jgi:hypothetical protein
MKKLYFQRCDITNGVFTLHGRPENGAMAGEARSTRASIAAGLRKRREYKMRPVTHIPGRAWRTRVPGKMGWSPGIFYWLG